MKRIIFFTFILFLIPKTVYSAAQIQQALMTMSPPASGCATPVEATTLLTTDTRAFLWFLATDVSAGDVFSTAYYTPSGAYYATPSGSFEPVPSAGTWCFTDAPFNIDGNLPATTPGVWTVKIGVNGILLRTVTFTIAQPGGGGGGDTSNLLRNGGAEEGPGGGYSGLASIPGWTTDGNVAVVAYSNSESAFTSSSPGPAVRGNNYFAGGNSPSARISQNIDVSSSASSIDAGTQPYTLSGWLGGWDGQDDNVVVSATFWSALGSQLGAASIGPVLAEDRNGTSSLLERSVSDKLPSGTRSVRVSLDFTRVSGTASDGAADNIVFSLSAIGGGGSTGSGAYYRFENGANGAPATGPGSILDSVGSDHGTPSGAVSYSSDVPVATVPATGASNSRSLAFTPTGKVDFSGAFPLNTLTNATLEFWFKPTGSAGEMGFLWTRTDITDTNRFNSGMRSNGSSRWIFFDYRAPNGTLHTLCENIPISYSGWTHVAVVKSRNVWTCFSNGVQSGQPVTDANPSLPNNSGWNLNGRGLFPFTGLLDEIRISSTALSPSQFLKPPSGGGGGTCSYMVQPQSASVPAAGYTGTILVSTQSNCTWTATSSVPWITILAGTGTGATSGAVSYRVDANTTSAVRTGNITIGDRTVPVTQEAGVSCSYTILPASNSMPALGGSSGIRLTTGARCPWTASVASGAASWLHLTSAASGAGPSTINYTADPNTASSSRTGAITVADQTFTLSQAGGASTTGPAISDGGIVNAASNRGAAIARGSFFTIYGQKLGPAAYQQATNYPIPDTLGGVVVTISQGSYSKRAYLHFVSAAQINAILPSDTPLGAVKVTVSFNGVPGLSATINVVEHAFGIFSTAGGVGPGIIQNFNSATDAPLNMPSYPATPDQIGILWGTGLGPITTGDNNPPPGGDLPVAVEIRVGGKPAGKLYSGRAPGFAGVDNVYFKVPAGAPQGCSVPVQVKVDGQWSNEVRMAISPDGSRCQDALNPFGNLTSTGGTLGMMGLARINLNGQLLADQPPVNASIDLGAALFSKVAAGGELGFSLLQSMPPVGTCSSLNRAIDFGSLLTSGGGSLDPTLSGDLDAGAQITVSGPAGSMPLSHMAADENTGPYIGILGADIPVLGSDAPPPFLDRGPVTISAPGGKDIGAFSTTLDLVPGIVWTNQGQVDTIDRSKDLRLTWTGGQSNQVVVIAAFSTDQRTKATGGFVCYAPASAGAFSVPASTLADLPVTGATTGITDSLGLLAILGAPANPTKFTASGLDNGFLFNLAVTAKAIQVK